MSYPVQLQDEEEVIATIRRHPVHLWVREAVIVIILLVVFYLWFTFGIGSVGPVATFWNAVAIIALIAGLVMGYTYWYRFHNDVWLITSERLVDSTRTTPFSHNVTTASLLNLQDINVRQRGISQTMFQYGDVICQTASASGDTFEFKGVADPQELLDQIETCRSDARKRQRGGATSAPASDDSVASE